MSDVAHWTIDRRIPLALIFALLVQTAGALLWAGAAAERIARLETAATSVPMIGERTTRLEEQMSYVRASLDRIERKIDGLKPGRS